MITHKGLETRCDDFMKQRGWYKAKRRTGLFNRLPDRIYSKPGAWPLVFEIKPDNIRMGEIQKGIGQCVFYLPYQVKPYLVLPEHWLNQEIKNVLKQLPIGVLAYDGDLRIYQKASDRDFRDLLPAPELEVDLKLTRDTLQEFLSRYPRGEYALADIVSDLRKEYPLLGVVYPGVIARMLHTMWCDRVPDSLLAPGQKGAWFRINYTSWPVAAWVRTTQK